MAFMPRKPLNRDSKEIDEVMTELGTRIAALRKERGLSQGELAETLRVSQNLISAYELGKVRIGADTVVALAKVFGVSSDGLLGLGDSVRPRTIKDRRFLRRLRAIDNLSRRKKDALLTTIDALIGGGQSRGRPERSRATK